MRNLTEITDDLGTARSTFNRLTNERATLEAIPDRSDGQNERLARVAKGEERLLADFKRLNAEAQVVLSNMDPEFLESGDGSPLHRSPFASQARGSGGRPGPLASAVAAAGFDLRSRPSVKIPAAQFYNAWVFPSTADMPPLVTPSIAGVVADRRYLHPLLPQEDLGDSLAITDFKQTVETVTGTIERDPSAATAKALYEGTVVAITEPARQVALVAENIPAAVVNALPAFNAWLETELSQQIGRAIDAHAVGEIVVAVPGITNVGTDPLPDAIRKAVTAMRNAGANPSLIAVNPAQSESLDLLRTADGIYIRGMTSTNTGPLWELTVIETPSVATLGASAGPLVIDPGLLGLLFTGPTAFDADPFTGFKSNLVSFRVEMNLRMHVRNIVGARQLRT